MKVLDHGYVELIETWGSDERIVEAARMSTSKGFQGWGPKPCPHCSIGSSVWGKGCEKCHQTGKVPGDEKLLEFLWVHKHATPFEMAGMTVEIQAPIFVFREWHRHRSQSYNELSARYTPIPNVNYMPTRQRIIDGAKASGNRQAQGTHALLVEGIDDWIHAVEAAYDALERTYQTGLSIGIPKELARIIVPVGRYSRMRASANLRNWLAFLTLRTAPEAQWEIRQYANEVAKLVEQHFPHTHALFIAR